MSATTPTSASSNQVSPQLPHALVKPTMSCPRIALIAVGVLGTLAVAYVSIPSVAAMLAGKTVVVLAVATAATVLFICTCSKGPAVQSRPDQRPSQPNSTAEVKPPVRSSSPLHQQRALSTPGSPEILQPHRLDQSDSKSDRSDTDSDDDEDQGCLVVPAPTSALLAQPAAVTQSAIFERSDVFASATVAARPVKSPSPLRSTDDPQADSTSSVSHTLGDSISPIAAAATAQGTFDIKQSIAFDQIPASVLVGQKWETMTMEALLQDKDWLKELSNTKPGDDFCRRWTQKALEYTRNVMIVDGAFKLEKILEVLKHEILFEKQILKASDCVLGNHSINDCMEGLVRERYQALLGVEHFEQYVYVLPEIVFKYKLLSPDVKPCASRIREYLLCFADRVLDQERSGVLTTQEGKIILLYNFVPANLTTAFNQAKNAAAAIRNLPPAQSQSVFEGIVATFKKAFTQPTALHVRVEPQSLTAQATGASRPKNLDAEQVQDYQLFVKRNGTEAISQLDDKRVRSLFEAFKCYISIECAANRVSGSIDFNQRFKAECALFGRGMKHSTEEIQRFVNFFAVLPTERDMVREGRLTEAEFKARNGVDSGVQVARSPQPLSAQPVGKFQTKKDFLKHITMDEYQGIKAILQSEEGRRLGVTIEDLGPLLADEEIISGRGYAAFISRNGLEAIPFVTRAYEPLVRAFGYYVRDEYEAGKIKGLKDALKRFDKDCEWIGKIKYGKEGQQSAIRFIILPREKSKLEAKEINRDEYVARNGEQPEAIEL